MKYNLFLFISAFIMHIELSAMKKEEITDSRQCIAFIHTLYNKYPTHATLDDLEKNLKAGCITHYCAKSKALFPKKFTDFTPKIIKKYVKEGADVNSRKRHDLFIPGTLQISEIQTPLIYHLLSNRSDKRHECLATFLALGANQNIRLKTRTNDNYHMPKTFALLIATTEQDIESIKLLLKNGPEKKLFKKAYYQAIADQIESIIELFKKYKKDNSI